MDKAGRVSEYLLRVFYEDTDATGVVYHANYLRYFERGRTEWLRDLGINQHRLHKELNIAFTVVSAEIRFRKPARLDDELRVVTQLGGQRAASFEFEQQLFCAQQLLITGQFRIACLDAAQFKPCAIPEFLRLKEFE